jgi:hypothetical protein
MCPSSNQRLRDGAFSHQLSAISLIGVYLCFFLKAERDYIKWIWLTHYFKGLFIKESGDECQQIKARHWAMGKG